MEKRSRRKFIIGFKTAVVMEAWLIGLLKCTGLFVMLLTCHLSNAQKPVLTPMQEKIDSLKEIVRLQKEDTNQVNALNALCKVLYGAGDYENLMNYGQQAKELSIRLHYDKGIAYSYLITGTSFLNHANYPKALNCFFNALKMFEKTGDKKGMANSLINLGNIYYQEGDFAKARNYYSKTLAVCEIMGNKQLIAFALNNLGNCYYAGKEYDKALDYYNRTLLIRKEIKDLKGITTSLNNIGDIYTQQGEYREALNNFSRALSMKEEIKDNPGISLVHAGIGYCYLLQRKYTQAKDHYTKSLVLARETGSSEIVIECYKRLSEISENNGQPEQALKDYKLYIACRDSVFNEENTKKLVRSEMNFEFDKKTAEAKARQEKQEAIASADAKRQRTILLAVSGLGVLVLLFAIFIYRSFLQKRKANIEITEQKHIIEAKQKEILDSFHYAKRIQNSLLPPERYIERMIKSHSKKKT